jgi:serine/threonine protein kinase
MALAYPDARSKPVAQAESPFGGFRLDDGMGSGALGTTWRGVLTDGSEVAIKRLATRGRNSSAGFERVQRASELQNPNLLEILTVFQEEGRFWVASRLDDGVPLGRLLRRGRLRPAYAVAVGMGVLNALTSLHQIGLCHGAIHARNIHVGRDGTVRLGDYGLTSAPSGQSPAARRAADVRAVGALLCSILGVPTDSSGGNGSRRSKAAQSPLGVAVRTIASSRRKLPPGQEAIHASLTLWEAAGGMATARRQAQIREQLARMVATEQGTAGVMLRLVDAHEPAAPPPQAPSAPERVSSAPSRSVQVSAVPPTFLAGMVALLLVIVVTVGAMVAVLAPSSAVEGSAPVASAQVPSTAPSQAPVTTPSQASPTQPPPAPPSPQPPQLVLPPASAGEVETLTLRSETPTCAPGSVCHVRVDLTIRPSRRAHPLTWTLYSIDGCTGQLTPLGTAGATVLRGWTRVLGDSYPHVPAGHASRLVAITDGPSPASSAPVDLAAASGCAG